LREVGFEALSIDSVEHYPRLAFLGCQINVSPCRLHGNAGAAS
jgi:hypothetical protein